MRGARTLLTVLPVAVLVAAPGSASAASALILPGGHGPVAGSLVQVQEPASAEPGATDAELAALWAAALAEAEELEREAEDEEDGTPTADADVPVEDEDTEYPEDDAEDEDAAPASRGGSSRAGRARLVSAKVAGTGKRRRIVVTCARANDRKACAGTVQARGAKGQVLKSWKVRVKSGRTTVVRAPAALRRVTVARAT